MTKAILFDLDGTLLPMDTEKFVERYIRKLSAYVAHEMEPKAFVDTLWKSTFAMMENKEVDRTNEQVFEEAFLSLSNKEKGVMWPLFDQFYREIFPTFSEWTSPTPIGKNIVKEADRQGYKVAVATNPVFPEAAIAHRLKWAEIHDQPFELVTFYENSYCTKPHIEYYQQICKRLDVEPQDCIMVGNDMQEDMVASRIGMKTYLVEDYKIDRGSPQYDINDSGSLEDLYHKLNNKKGIFQWTNFSNRQILQ